MLLRVDEPGGEGGGGIRAGTSQPYLSPIPPCLRRLREEVRATHAVAISGTDPAWMDTLQGQPLAPVYAVIPLTVNVREGPEPKAHIAVERIEPRSIWQMALAVYTSLRSSGVMTGIELAKTGSVDPTVPPMRIDLELPGPSDPETLMNLLTACLVPVRASVPVPPEPVPVLSEPVIRVRDDLASDASPIPVLEPTPILLPEEVPAPALGVGPPSAESGTHLDAPESVSALDETWLVAKGETPPPAPLDMSQATYRSPSTLRLVRARPRPADVHVGEPLLPHTPVSGTVARPSPVPVRPAPGLEPGERRFPSAQELRTPSRTDSPPASLEKAVSNPEPEGSTTQMKVEAPSPAPADVPSLPDRGREEPEPAPAPPQNARGPWGSRSHPEETVLTFARPEPGRPVTPLPDPTVPNAQGNAAPKILQSIDRSAPPPLPWPAGAVSAAGSGRAQESRTFPATAGLKPLGQGASSSTSQRPPRIWENQKVPQGQVVTGWDFQTKPQGQPIVRRRG